MILGIDEAGKGPVIGPLVICGVCCDDYALNRLVELGVKDSKKLTRKKRIELAEIIRSLCGVKVIKIGVQELNDLMEKLSLNEILKKGYIEIIRSFKPKTVYIDCPEIDTVRFANKISEMTGVEVVASHRADEIYPIVSCASIVAKVERDLEIEKLKDVYGDFGSGYPADKKTAKFLKDYLKKNGTFPPIVRRKWKTLRRLSNYDLSDFF
jgi:ribonuclease HII